MIKKHIFFQMLQTLKICSAACRKRAMRSSRANIFSAALPVRSDLPGWKHWAWTTPKKPLPPGLPDSPDLPASRNSRTEKSACSFLPHRPVSVSPDSGLMTGQLFREYGFLYISMIQLRKWKNVTGEQACTKKGAQGNDGGIWITREWDTWNNYWLLKMIQDWIRV